MQAHSLLFCQKCLATTKHTRQAKYDSLGGLRGSVERCAVCLSDHAEGATAAHEAPLADPPPVTAVLSDTEIKRAKFQRHLLGTGRLTEWPHDWWEMQTPGVWG